MVDCVFCNIDESNIILESKHSVAFYDTYPVSKGHMLLVPKKHVSDYFDILPQEKNDLLLLLEEAKTYLQLKFDPDGFNVGINIGKCAGQTIFHAHVHIIPRYNGDMKNPTGGVRGVIPNKQKY